MANHSPVDAHNSAPSSEPLNVLSPADFVENSPLFKLPPELRNRIYRYVFGPSQAVNRFHIHWDPRIQSGERYPVGNAGHTSILAVNRFVKAEAMEVLYGTRIVRGNDLNLKEMLNSHDIASRVRSVEITRCIDTPCSKVGAGDFRKVLRRLRGLSGIRSIVILSDSFSAVLDPSHDAPIPVTTVAKALGNGPATCVDIGQYRLHGDLEGVQIVNRKLVEMWPAVRATPEVYNGLDDALAIMGSLQVSEKVRNAPTWASHSSLRCWVDIQQQYLAMLKSGKWHKIVRFQEGEEGDDNDDDEDENEDDEVKYFFFRHTGIAAMRRPILLFPLLRGGEYALKDLRPGYDNNLLNEASEFLAVNMAGYNRLSRHPTIQDQWNLFPTVWEGTWADTGQTVLEYMTEQQRIAVLHSASLEFVLDPSLHDDILACNLIDCTLAKGWLETKFGSAFWMSTPLATASPKEIRKLTHLYMAVSDYQFLGGQSSNGYHLSRDHLSERLLRD